MKTLLSLVVFVMIIAGPFYAQIPGRFRANAGAAHSGGEAKRMIDLTSKVLTHRYCLQYLDEQTQYAKLRLELQLESKNVSDRTLIIPRYGGSPTRTLLAKDLDALNKGDYAYESRASLKQLAATNSELLKPEPPDWLFQIVRPNGTHVYSPVQSITIDLEDLGDGKRRLQDGNYVLQITVQTWSWDYETAKKLRLRWAKHGDLWYENMTSEPVAVSIQKPDIIAARCQ